MTYRYETTITKTIKFFVPTAYDAAGQVADSQVEEADVDVNVNFKVGAPEHDVGIMSYYIDDYEAFYYAGPYDVRMDVELDDEDLEKIIQEWENNR